METVVRRIADSRRKGVDATPIGRRIGIDADAGQPSIFNTVADFTEKQISCVTDAASVYVNVVMPAMESRPLKESADEEHHRQRRRDYAEVDPLATTVWKWETHGRGRIDRALNFSRVVWFR